ncbi:MAG: AraC family transcriptional regulator [Clostridiaceae bacterium]|nr:AraC family transcriptional regulator [Clostridiaceae bacterium]
MFHFDLNVYRFVKIKYLPGYLVERHTHDFFHLFYISKGSGKLEIDRVMYQVKEGELYIVPTGIEHSIIARDDCCFQTIEIKFIPSDTNIIRMLSKIPHQLKDVDPSIPIILMELVQEASRKEMFYRDVINNKFMGVILIILRKYLATEKNDGENGEDNCSVRLPCGKGIFDKVIKHINDNIETKIKISELAKHFGFSEAHFCTAFKETYNISPGQYINNYKLHKAKEYILYSDMNISQIANALGFQSLHYFSRFFKKKVGMSPQEYRHRKKDNIFLELIDGIADNYKVRII